MERPFTLAQYPNSTSRFLSFKKLSSFLLATASTKFSAKIRFTLTFIFTEKFLLPFMFLQEHYTTYNKVIKTDDIAIPQNIFTVQLEQAIHQAFRLLTVRFKLYIGTYVHRHKNIAIFTVRSYTVVIIPDKNSTKIPIHPTILFLFNLSPLGLHKTVTSGMLSKSDQSQLESLLLKGVFINKKYPCCCHDNTRVIQGSKSRCSSRSLTTSTGRCRPRPLFDFF